MKKISFLLLFLLALSGCKTMPSGNFPSNFNKKEPVGLVVGSFAIKIEKPIYNSYFLHYVNVNNPEIDTNYMFQISPEQTFSMKHKPDITEDGYAIYYFSTKLPQGNYTFTTLRLFENGGFVQSLSNATFDFPFEVSSGNITYVGEIRLDANEGKIIRNYDKKERDQKFLKENFSIINWEF